MTHSVNFYNINMMTIGNRSKPKTKGAVILKNMKKIFAILLFVILLVCMSACGLTMEQKAYIRQSERDAQRYMKTFLKENYEEYKIHEVKQVVRSEFWPSVVTDVTKIVATVDDKDVIFYYQSNTNKIWSNENYDKVLSELEAYLRKHPFLSKAVELNSLIEIRIDDV